MEKMNEQISDRRAALGLYQGAVGEQSNMTQQMYQRIESGGDCKLSSLERIAGALNCQLAMVPDEKMALVDIVLNAPNARVAAKRIEAYQKKVEKSVEEHTSTKVA